MLRKLLFSSLALLGLSQFSIAQCIADAGPDKHWCGALSNTNMPILGGTPSASGGQGPYTYEWSIKPITISPNTTFFTSLFLDDTTASNPQMIDFWGNDMTFFLKITDANNISCFDSVKVTSSNIAQHVDKYWITINAGDSIQLKDPNVWSMFPIDSVLWRPNHGLTDSNATRPWAKPSHDIAYYSTIWDSAGCTVTGHPFLFIHVNTIDLLENRPTKIEIYPTLICNNLHINFQKNPQNTEVKIINISGETVLSEYLFNDKNTVNIDYLPAGLYYAIVSENGFTIFKQKLIRN